MNNAEETLLEHTPPVSAEEQHRVIFASSLGTVFEWYDFYLYGTLAVFFGALFFPKGNETAALLASLATFGACFAVRPFGALVFGRLGDMVGRKHTFLITITLMGISTAGIGFLPTFEQIGWAAPSLLVALRLLQGLALGGEYGAAAMVAHSGDMYYGLWYPVMGALLAFAIGLIWLPETKDRPLHSLQH